MPSNEDVRIQDDSPNGPLNLVRPEHYVHTVCGHYSMRKDRTCIAGAEELSKNPSLRQGKVCLIVGWCPGCESYLQRSACPGGVRKEAFSPRDLLPALQLWVWKHKERLAIPMDLKELPLDFLDSTTGPQPHDVEDEELRTGRMVLFNVLSALDLKEIRIVSRGYVVPVDIQFPPKRETINFLRSSEPQSPTLFKTDPNSNINFHVVSRMAQWLTLAYLTDQPYDSATWWENNPTPSGRMPVPLAWYSKLRISKPDSAPGAPAPPRQNSLPQGSSPLAPPLLADRRVHRRPLPSAPAPTGEGLLTPTTAGGFWMWEEVSETSRSEDPLADRSSVTAVGSSHGFDNTSSGCGTRVGSSSNPTSPTWPRPSPVRQSLYPAKRNSSSNHILKSNQYDGRYKPLPPLPLRLKSTNKPSSAPQVGDTYFMSSRYTHSSDPCRNKPLPIQIRNQETELRRGKLSKVKKWWSSLKRASSFPASGSGSPRKDA